jgi:membrane protease YdiL (CAAX protease family)
MTPLPPPVPGTAVGASSAISPVDSRFEATLPLAAAVGAVGVLTVSLLASKYLLDALVGLGWPVAAYVTLLAAVGYGPSLWWCWFASRHWGSGRVGADVGLTPRFADIGWGPVIWLGAVGAQVAVGALVVALGVPLVSNTEGLDEISADRTYVVSLVISAVVAAPIVEEMVFRGVVMRGLRSRMPTMAVVPVQGVLFGVAHIDPARGVGNIGLVLVLSGVGVAFGVAVALLGRIGPTIVAHAIFNGAVLLVVLTGVAERLDSSPLPGAEQIGVVDQADVAEPGGNRDSSGSGSALRPVESTERTQRGAVEHLDVVERREWLLVDHASCDVEHVADRRARCGGTTDGR